ncbi:MAG: hypothetical protein WCG91_03910 [Candidatus Shapirobacteria bacterium]
MWIFLLILFLSSPFKTQAIELTSSASVSVSASIGKNEVIIDGYTSPSSRVELSSNQTYDVTYSQKNGYFKFDRTLLPKSYSDLCLIAIDENYRHTIPVCIPPPPRDNYLTNIGPIILPPTLTLDTDKIKPGSTVITSGQSIPNSKIEVHFYKIDDKAQSFPRLDVALAKLRPKSAYAYSLPTFNTISDSEGNFSLNLPTVYSSNYRLYAAASFEDNPSPKSNTLIYKMPSQENFYLYIILPLFIITLTFFFYLLYLRFFPQRHLLPAIYHWWPSLRPKYAPALYPEHITRSFNIPK